ncbi:MAG: hypothetical protein JNK87_03245 [Bryobacterales bacterium]|nr:hypothetical protein [Bryobacterales bacterium]
MALTRRQAIGPDGRPISVQHDTGPNPPSGPNAIRSSNRHIASAAPHCPRCRQSHERLLLLRRPDHHATPGRGMGLCVFNNVAIAARDAQRQRGILRHGTCGLPSG